MTTVLPARARICTWTLARPGGFPHRETESALRKYPHRQLAARFSIAQCFRRERWSSQSPGSMNSSSGRIHVLGLGNLGRLFAHELAIQPSPPPITLLLHRRSLLEEWGNVGKKIEITTEGGISRTWERRDHWKFNCGYQDSQHSESFVIYQAPPDL